MGMKKCTQSIKSSQHKRKKEWQSILKNHTQLYLLTKRCGKTHHVLELTEYQYNKHFDYIIIICPTFRLNKTYHSKDWLENNHKVWLIEPKEKLYQWIGKLSQLLLGLETLFTIDGTMANKDLDKNRQPLLELSISSRHRDHYLWLLTQSFLGIPKKLREQAKSIFVLYPKARIDLKMIHDENDVLRDKELVVARDFLEKSNMHTYTYNILGLSWVIILKLVK